MLPAWSLIHRGTLALPTKGIDYRVLSESAARHGSLYSNRPVGMIAVSIPGQLFSSSPSSWGIAITASLLSAISVWASFRLWGPAAGTLVAIGTPLLFAVGRTLWPETVCVPLLLTGLLLLRTKRHLWVLLPLVGVITLCRPPFGLLAALIFAILVGRSRTSVLPFAGLAVGIVVLLAYAHVVFGEWTLAPGYPSPRGVNWHSLWLGTVSAARGVLWWTPWLVFLRVRDRAWIAALVVAAGYVVASWLSYDAWGGSGWVGYRYPIPLVVLTAAFVHRPANAALAHIFDLAVAWSVALAIVGTARDGSLSHGLHPWSPGVPVAETFAVFVCVAALIVLLRRRVQPDVRPASRPVSVPTP
jgi:hypothetical protein